MASFNQVPSGQPTYTATYLPSVLYNTYGDAGGGDITAQWLVHNFKGENNGSYILTGLTAPSYTSATNTTSAVIKDVLLYYQQITTYPLTGQRWPKRI